MSLIYKILRKSEWIEAEKTGLFAGSPDDFRDGYLHFSKADQVITTFDKYFAKELNLLLLSVDPTRLGPRLRWEVSRNGDRFPHFYGELPLELVQSVIEIGRGPDGRPIFPPEIS